MYNAFFREKHPLCKQKSNTISITDGQIFLTEKLQEHADNMFVFNVQKIFVTCFSQVQLAKHAKEIYSHPQLAVDCLPPLPRANTERISRVGVLAQLGVMVVCSLEMEVFYIANMFFFEYCNIPPKKKPEPKEKQKQCCNCKIHKLSDCLLLCSSVLV